MNNIFTWYVIGLNLGLWIGLIFGWLLKGKQEGGE